MLDIKMIREQPEVFKQNQIRRGKDPEVIDSILELDREKRELMTQDDELRAKRNLVSKKPTAEEIENLRSAKEHLDKNEKRLEEIVKMYDELIWSLPNLLAEEVPQGKNDQENKVVKNVGTPPVFSFQPKDHMELGQILNLMDFERGAKVAGSGFYYAKNELVLLDLALQRFALEKLVSKGFTPLITPDLAKTEICMGTGFMPRGPETQVYSIENSDLNLIGTAEITVAGLHSGEIIDSNELPKKYVALSHCFRTEDGSYGRYSKGLYRMHQFTKVEMFILCKPEDSKKYHEEMLAIEEEVFTELGLAYRVILQCTGDIAAPSHKTYDIEAWMPSRQGYGEVTSTSNTTDFQARRLNIRYKDDTGNNQMVHMLNGTVLTNSRTILSLLENYQDKDGNIMVPEVLRKYLDFTFIKKK